MSHGLPLDQCHTTGKEECILIWPQGLRCEKIGGIFAALAPMKVSFAYDHKNKMPHHFDTLGHGGYGNSVTHYRSAPYIRTVLEAAMV
jgi:hypothetical protein